MEKLIIAGIVVSGCALAQVPGQHHSKHMDAAEYARVLDDPSRDEWQKPHQVIEALQLKKDEVVADIGAGTGYFAKRFAQHAGTVFAVDIEPKLLELAAKNAPANLHVVLATASDPKLRPASADTIFICNVLHHVDGRTAYLKKLQAVLKPGGRIAVIEFHKRDLPVGPPPSMKISEPDLIEEFRKLGMRVARRHDFLPYQYFLEFRAIGLPSSI